MKLNKEFKNDLINSINDYENNQASEINLEAIDYINENISKNNFDFNGKYCIIINRQILDLLKQVLDIYIRCGLLQLDYSLYPFLQNKDMNSSNIDKSKIMYLLKQVRNQLINNTEYDKFKLDMSDWCIDEHSENLSNEMKNALMFLETLQYFDKDINNKTRESNIIINELQ